MSDFSKLSTPDLCERIRTTAQGENKDSEARELAWRVEFMMEQHALGVRDAIELLKVFPVSDDGSGQNAHVLITDQLTVRRPPGVPVPEEKRVKPKDRSLVARMAGNIAGHYVTGCSPVLHPESIDNIATCAVDLAVAILEKADKATRG